MVRLSSATLRRLAVTVTTLTVAAVGVDQAAAQTGAPELLDQPGYLNHKRARSADGIAVRETFRRIDRRTGKVRAAVNVIRRLDASYVRRRQGDDAIEQAVRCGGILWIVRNVRSDIAYVDNNDDRLYWMTSAASGEVTSAPFDQYTDVSELTCGHDDSVYVSATDDRLDDVILRATVPERVEFVRPSGSSFTLVRDEVAYLSGRRGLTTFVDPNGSTTQRRPRLRAGLSRTAGLASDGTDLYVALASSDGPFELRRFASRRRGLRFPTPGGVDSTVCGGMVFGRSVSLTIEEIVFLRRGRVARRVRTDRRGVMLDPRAGRYAVGRTVYRACGKRAGRVAARLRQGAATGSEFIHAASFD